MILTRGDLALLKQLKAAGGRGRNVRELNIRATLDRLVKGGYLWVANRSRLCAISHHTAWPRRYSRARFVTAARRLPATLETWEN